MIRVTFNDGSIVFYENGQDAIDTSTGTILILDHMGEPVAELDKVDVREKFKVA